MFAEKLILGTVQFGLNYGINNSTGKPAKAEIFDILNYATEHGIQELDCAQAYGDAQMIIGDFLKQSNVQFRLNSKFHTQGATLAEQVKQTLNDLQTTQINAYFFHDFEDLYRDKEKTIRSLLALKDAGSIAKIGVSVYSNEQVEYCANIEAIDVIQTPFNLLDNTNKRQESFKLVKDSYKELQVRSVFLQGLFAKETTTFPRKLMPLIPFIERIYEGCRYFNIPVMTMALAYAVQMPMVDKVLIGVETKEQLKQNLEAGNTILDEAVINFINQINVEDEALLYPYNWT